MKKGSFEGPFFVGGEGGGRRIKDTFLAGFGIERGCRRGREKFSISGRVLE